MNKVVLYVKCDEYKKVIDILVKCPNCGRIYHALDILSTSICPSDDLGGVREFCNYINSAIELCKFLPTEYSKPMIVCSKCNYDARNPQCDGLVVVGTV